MLSDAPCLAQRSHHTPLYTPAVANETICWGVSGAPLRVTHGQTARIEQSLREVVADAGKQSHRKHAAAVIRLLQVPQRTLPLSFASLPEVHLMMMRR